MNHESRELDNGAIRQRLIELAKDHEEQIGQFLVAVTDAANRHPENWEQIPAIAAKIGYIAGMQYALGGEQAILEITDIE